MRKLPADGTFVGRRAELERARTLIAARQHLLILGPTGMGLTRFLQEAVIRPLNALSKKRFPDGRGRLYWDFTGAQGTDGDLRRLEEYLVRLYPDVPGVSPLDPAAERRPSGAGAVHRLTWLLKNIQEHEEKNGFAFFLVIDDIERLPARAGWALKMLSPYCVICAAGHPARYAEKAESFYLEITFETIELRPLAPKEADSLLARWAEKFRILPGSPGGLRPDLWRLLKARIRGQILPVPKAMVRMLEYCRALRAVAQRDSREFGARDIRRIPLHRCGVFERDLTTALLLVIFGFVAMRFLTMRTFERWLYGVYAVLSFSSLMFYRIILRRLSRREENEFIWTFAEGKIHRWLWPVMPLVHIMASVLFLNVLLSTFLIETTWAAMAVCAAFSLLPDIDIPTSTISRMWRRVFSLPGLRRLRVSQLPETLEETIGHRTLTHSIIGVLIAAVLASPLALLDFRMFLAAPAGALGHILYDALSPSGVKLFWPSRVSYGMPAPLSWRIPVGSGREVVFASCVVAPLCLFFTWAGFKTWGGVYAAATKDPSAMTQLAMRKMGEKEVFLTVDHGFWRTTQTPVEDGRFRVAAVGRDTLWVESREGRMFRVSAEDPRSAVVIRRSHVEEGGNIRQESGRIQVSEGKDLDGYLREIPDGAYVSAFLSVYAEKDIADRFLSPEVSDEYRAIQFRPVLARDDLYELILSFAPRKQLEEDLSGGSVWPLRGEIVWTRRVPL